MRLGRAWRPKPGEHACGDRVVAIGESTAEPLLAVIDGLGHGPKAAAAADAAAELLAAHASLPLVELFERCNAGLGGTRGVAMTVLRADLERNRVMHAAVGNVELLTLRSRRDRPIAEPGVVGSRMRRVRERSLTTEPGDLFALISDGVSSRFELESYQGLEAQPMAEAILRDHGKDHDDASCAVLAF